MVLLHYSFIDLDDEQKQRRRHLLDKYGFLAQLSVLAPLFLIQVFFLVAWIQTRSGSNHVNLKSPNSPVRKSLHKANDKVRSLSASVCKVLWWCGDDVSLLGIQLGTKGAALGAVAWTAWLLLLSFLETGEDYLHLTKRFGIVAASQLPFHYLLAVKTPYSPVQRLTHASHETLNTIHQTLGRIVTLFLYCHVSLYINFYIQNRLLVSKLQEAYVVCGVVGIILFTIIGTSSLAAVRRRSYRIFLAIHIVLSTALLPILFFHVHHIRVYIYESLAILLLNLLFRTTAAKSYTTANVTLIPETQLVDVSIALSSKGEAARWMPGQHAYLSLPDQAVRAAINKNPFTLSSVPASDSQLRFVARIQSGNTVALANAASSGKSIHHLLVEGPYGVATHSDALLSYDRVLMIAGGIGGTFIMPLYRQLLSDLSPSKGSHRRQKVSAIWVARSSAEVAWAVPKDDKEGFFERLHVHVTRSEEPSLSQDGSAQLDDGSAPDAYEHGIELEERTNLLAKDDSSQVGSTTGLQLRRGRPGLGHLVQQAFANAHETVAVVVCGPNKLGQAVRREVAPYVYSGRTVWFWNESFSL